MSKKDDRIAELEAEVMHLGTQLRLRWMLVETLVAMIVRAAKEVGEPRLKAAILEDLQGLDPTVSDIAAVARTTTDLSLLSEVGNRGNGRCSSE